MNEISLAPKHDSEDMIPLTYNDGCQGEFPCRPVVH